MGGEHMVDTVTAEIKLIEEIYDLTAGITENGAAALFY